MGWRPTLDSSPNFGCAILRAFLQVEKLEPRPTSDRTRISVYAKSPSITSTGQEGTLSFGLIMASADRTGCKALSSTLSTSFRPAESLQNSLLGTGRHRAPLKPRPLVWPRDGAQQLLEPLEILSLACRIKRRFHQVAAGNEYWIHIPHQCSARLLIFRFFVETPAPSSSPVVIRARVDEQCPYSRVAFRSGRGIAQPSEGQSEVSALAAMRCSRSSARAASPSRSVQAKRVEHSPYIRL